METKSLSNRLAHLLIAIAIILTSVLAALAPVPAQAASATVQFSGYVSARGSGVQARQHLVTFTDQVLVPVNGEGSVVSVRDEISGQMLSGISVRLPDRRRALLLAMGQGKRRTFRICETGNACQLVEVLRATD